MNVVLSASVAGGVATTVGDKLLRDARNICLSAGCQAKQYGFDIGICDGSELREKFRLLTTKDKASTVLISLRAALNEEQGARVVIEYAPSSGSSRLIADMLKEGLSRLNGLSVETKAEKELMMVTVYGVPVVTVEYRLDVTQLGTLSRGKQTGQLGWLLATLIKEKAGVEHGGIARRNS